MKLILVFTCFFVSATSFAVNLDWRLNLDAYHSYNLNSPPNDGPNGESINDNRSYDDLHNSIQLNMFELGFTVKKASTSLVADLGFGRMADNLNGTGNARNLNQFYLETTLASLGNWKFQAGKLYTHMGLESVMAKDNWNYSRGLIYTLGTPSWHTGVAMTPPSQGSLNFGVFVYNGSDSIGQNISNKTLHDNNSSKSLGGRVQIAPADAVNITYNLLLGPEASNNNGDNTIIHNVNAVVGLGETIKVAAEFVLGSTEDQGPGGDDVEWLGFSGYFKYQADPNWYLAARFENLEDKNGGLIDTTEDQKLTSLTFTFGKNFGDGLEFRGEMRLDKSDYDFAYTESDGSGADDQTTFTAGLLYTL